MLVRQVTLKSFRNYSDSCVSLKPGKTILLGDNAQGKTNFLEAIELASTGRSARASHDSELILKGHSRMQVEVLCEHSGLESKIVMSFALKTGTGEGVRPLEKRIQVNGVEQSIKGLQGRLVVVSFKSQDLSLLRGGPRYRREWLDEVALRLRPGFGDVLSNYNKVVLQRNRLLKDLSGRKVSVSDRDQLLAWDKQLARFGTQVIKQRLAVLSGLLAPASEYHSHLSCSRETLAADYIFKIPDAPGGDNGDAWEGSEPDAPAGPCQKVSVAQLDEYSEQELSLLLMQLLKERRAEEIARKQTLIGPHRDDIAFALNAADAVAFASQGQQRSLVLALKLAELKRIAQHLEEPPVLILDDVLAELDLTRQGLLMSAVKPDTQTIITTAHLSRFEPEWLDGADIFQVSAGVVSHLPS